LSSSCVCAWASIFKLSMERKYRSTIDLLRNQRSIKVTSNLGEKSKQKETNNEEPLELPKEKSSSFSRIL